jgi:hypothetical protein
MGAATLTALSAEATKRTAGSAISGSSSRLTRASLAAGAARLWHHVNLLHCVLLAHVVPSGECPRCDRKTLA